MKPRIRYINGCVELATNFQQEYRNVLSKNTFFTRHPTNEDVWYFFENKAGAEFFKEHKEFLEKYWDIDAEVYTNLLSWKDYTCGHSKIPAIIPDTLILEPYQEKALDYMLTNDKFCIFLGQGTGKTIITIAYLNSIFAAEGKLKVLIVTPKKVIGQYRKEIDKYLDDSSTIDITNYESLGKVTGYYDIIMYDESHKLKNCTSQVNKIATKLRAPRIYLFTGSPQDKNKHEILAQLKVLNPTLFPAKYKVYERFFYLDEYYQPIKDKPGTEMDDIIISMSYGETTENLLVLPDAKHVVLKCSFKDKTVYDTFRSKQVVTIGTEKIIADNPGVLRMQLKEMCNGFILYNKFDETTCKMSKEMLELENPKLDKLRELLLTLDTAVLYTQFDQDIVVIHKLLDAMGISHVCVNGKTNTKDSEQFLEDFKEGRVRVLVIQAMSGNAGLNLQNTNNMIFYSLPDSYIIFTQCTYRIRRRGQTKECNYYYLITEGTIEVVIHRALKNKKSFDNKMFELYRKGGEDERINTG